MPKSPSPRTTFGKTSLIIATKGGGENDVMAFDMKTLKIPIGSQLPELVQHKGTSSNKQFCNLFN